MRASVDDLGAAIAIVDEIAGTRQIINVPQAKARVSGMPSRNAAFTVGKRSVPTALPVKPRDHATIPLAFTPLDIPRDNTPVSDIYARYRPQRIDIAGAQEHPTPLVESISMASGAPPVPSVIAVRGSPRRSANGLISWVRSPRASM